MTESSVITVEATGETVGEAKWAALRELESRVPGLDRDQVQFQVVSEGERGLLGVGFTPAHVIATTEPGDAVAGGHGRRRRPAARVRSSSGSPPGSEPTSRSPLASATASSR